MRQAVIAAVLATMVLTWPAEAQLFPAPSGSQPSPGNPSAERIVLDLTTRTSAGGRKEGHCLVLETGHLSISVKLSGRTPDRPVLFEMYRVRGAEDALRIFDQPISRTPFEQQADIAEGLFCYSVANTEPEPAGAGLAQLSGLSQDVSIRMTLTPQ